MHQGIARNARIWRGRRQTGAGSWSVLTRPYPSDDKPTWVHHTVGVERLLQSLHDADRLGTPAPGSDRTHDIVRCGKHDERPADPLHSLAHAKDVGRAAVDRPVRDSYARRRPPRGALRSFG